MGLAGFRSRLRSPYQFRTPNVYITNDAPAISPPYDGFWTHTDQASRVAARLSPPTGAAFTDRSYTDMTGTGWAIAFLQIVLPLRRTAVLGDVLHPSGLAGGGFGPFVLARVPFGSPTIGGAARASTARLVDSSGATVGPVYTPTYGAWASITTPKVWHNNYNDEGFWTASDDSNLWIPSPSFANEAAYLVVEIGITVFTVSFVSTLTYHVAVGNPVETLLDGTTGEYLSLPTGISSGFPLQLFAEAPTLQALQL